MLENYLVNQWKVFPLKPGSKIPATAHGFKDATLDATQVDKWIASLPGCNWAVATGEDSGIVVVDVDVKDGGLDEVKKYNFPPTLTVSTPTGGMHLYYSYLGELIGNRTRLYPGIDIRASGGYVVAPPSKDYHFVAGFCKPAPLPLWLEAELKRERLPQTPSEGRDLSEREGRLSRQTLEFLVQGAQEGTWNARLFKASKDMQEQGWSKEDASERLITITGYLDAVDERTIQSAYQNLPKYQSRELSNNEQENLAQSSLILTPKDLSLSTIEYLSDKDAVRGQSTGLSALDKLLGGGKRLGEVTCWHAEAKVGKNTFWHALMYTWLQQKIPFAYASREITPESEIIPNFLSLQFNENAWTAEINADRRARYEAAMADWCVYFAKGYGYFPIEELKRWVDELYKLGVRHFWFDHLHYMLEDPEDHKAASKLIKEIKTLSKDLNIHIDLIIQPNKLMEGQKVSLASIKGGSAMGQAIDNLITLERKRNTVADNIVELELKVGRSKLCRPGKVLLQYNPKTTHFSVVDMRDVASEGETSKKIIPL